ncbi:SDR family oxidoreductase [Lederbergia sp. NSJ-179]|uniref:SDR family oxidoreductase n=1 Tax=Lederbergia sp. NSJ-179 TaxID=2931402 RepID=UPI001FD3A286|nr:SDR family oxidoreductase [Lederbergia sp. NSJ-179]MCJ7843600.1 SDR family oxidoreductase [Lederbergia sp. NSJ-179]
MNRKTVLITGASSGFGLFTTIELARRDFHVIATMRNLKNKDTIIELCKQKSIKASIEFVSLDITDAASIQKLTEQIAHLPSIDILINNAGFALGGFAEETSLQEYKEQFETNLFGTIAVTQALLPSMREQGRGRVINMSSISGKMAFPGLSPYVASKHALEGWTESLRLEVKPFGIEVALVEPGSYQTNIWTKGKRIAQKSKLPTSAYAMMMTAIEHEMEKGSQSYGDPYAVALLIAELCTKRRLNKLRYPIGKGVKGLLLAKQMTPWKLWEKIVLTKLNAHL